MHYYLPGLGLGMVITDNNLDLREERDNEIQNGNRNTSEGQVTLTLEQKSTWV